jgi:cell division protein FtsN
MKSRFFLFGIVLTLLFSLNACKTKQSAYRAAYEAAQERELREAAKQDQEKTTPVVKPRPDTNETFQREKVTAIDGSGSIRPYSVVIGSFINKTNAISLKERMQSKGYSPIVAQNEKGMYRVIVATFNDRAGAVAEKNRVKELYAPEFQDAWLLDSN